MKYQEFAPSPHMSLWIACHWRFEIEETDPPAFEHVIVPDGTLSISYTRADSNFIGPVVFAGPSTKAHRVPVRSGITYEGVRIHPAATGHLLSLDAQHLRDRIGLLEMHAPAAAATINEIIRAPSHANELPLEAAVAALALKSTRPDESIVRAVNNLLLHHGTGSISRLAAMSGLSSRQFRRKFQSHVGLTAKAFARLRRIRHACVLLLGDDVPNFASVSHAGGYSDQPHLARDFRGIFGMPPRLIVAYLQQIEHIQVQD